MKNSEFVTSDTHFGHTGLYKYGHRYIPGMRQGPDPIDDDAPMHLKRAWINAWEEYCFEADELLIMRWNAKVPPNAFVYHLGDLAFAKKGRVIELLKRLNGKIRLCMGNHDERVIKSQDIIRRFDWVRHYYESKTEQGTKICMMHYPFATWNKAHYGSWMFHGHSHGNLVDINIPRIDIGVDTHPNFEPYSYEEILERMKDRIYKSVDHE